MKLKSHGDTQLWEFLLPHSRTILAKAHEYVYHTGDKAIGLFFVHSGKIKLFTENEDGKEIVFQIVRPGFSFGETAIFHGEICPTSALALTDTKLLFISRQATHNLLESHPALANLFLPILARRQRILINRLSAMALRDVPQRLAAYLSQHDRHNLHHRAPADNFRIEVSRETIAGILGTSRESVSRAFTQLSALGLISVRGKSVSILNRKELSRFARIAETN